VTAPRSSQARDFIVVTQDHVGLGFAVRLLAEGHRVILATSPREDDRSPSRWPAYQRVGEGLVDRQPLAELMARRAELRDHYWLWDFNHSVAENETLRAEGFKVFGGGAHANTMEHDRAACLAFVERYGLHAPPSRRFDAPPEAIAFLEANPETAYVYKPDEGESFETFVPEAEEPADANQELRVHLVTSSHRGAFILQERKEGVETNAEVWFQNGEPVFAFMAIECKKKCALDLGHFVGCAFNFAFVVPLDCRAVKEVMGRLFPAYRAMKYTGFGDANFIAGKDGIWFLEKCERFGYNSHPNLFWNLSVEGMGEVLASLVDGRFTPHFAEGFGASLLMSTKEGSPGGHAVQFPPKLESSLYFWDVWKKDGLYLTAGYDQDGYVLLVNAHGFTMETAWEALLHKAARVRFPYRHYRADGDQTNYPSSPIRRYEALKAMGYI
jgi:phosphoribosylamine-glycine ligase